MNKCPAPYPGLLLHDIAREIRDVARIWRIEKAEDGMIFRAEVERKQFRVFVKRPGLNTTPNIPSEKNSPVFAVSSIKNLRYELQSFCSLK